MSLLTLNLVTVNLERITKLFYFFALTSPLAKYHSIQAVANSELFLLTTLPKLGFTG